MTRTCSKCGVTTDQAENFCEKCGTALPAETAGAMAAAAPQASPAIPAPAPQPAVLTVPPAKSRSGGGMKALALAAVLALIACAGAWFYLRKPAASSSSATTSTSVATTSATLTATTGTSSTAANSTIDTSSPATASTDSVAASTSADPNTTLASAADLAGSAAAEKSKPCSLVTRDEMSAIMGVPIQYLKVAEASCEYHTDAENSVQVETTWTGGGVAMAETKKFNSGLLEPIANLADEAYFHPAGVTHVRKGDIYVQINSRVYPNEQETELKIAQRAVAALKR